MSAEGYDRFTLTQRPNPPQNVRAEGNKITWDRSEPADSKENEPEPARKGIGA